jgi:hypothetical protein
MDRDVLRVGAGSVSRSRNRSGQNGSEVEAEVEHAERSTRVPKDAKAGLQLTESSIRRPCESCILLRGCTERETRRSSQNRRFQDLYTDTVRSDAGVDRFCADSRLSTIFAFFICKERTLQHKIPSIALTNAAVRWQVVLFDKG